MLEHYHRDILLVEQKVQAYLGRLQPLSEIEILEATLPGYYGCRIM